MDSQQSDSKTRGFQRRIAGEDAAVQHLLRKGYSIRARNFRTPRGEVDIVCETAGTIVFVEVKGWTSYGASDLEYALNSQKKQRIIGAARRYLLEHDIDPQRGIRFDVIFVDIKNDRIDHFEGAFESRWPG